MRFSCASCKGLTLARFALLWTFQRLNRILESLSWLILLILTVCFDFVDLEDRTPTNIFPKVDGLFVDFRSGEVAVVYRLARWFVTTIRFCVRGNSLRCALGTEDSPRRGSPVSVSSMSIEFGRFVISKTICFSSILLLFGSAKRFWENVSLARPA